MGCPFYRWDKWDLDWLCEEPKVAQIISRLLNSGSLAPNYYVSSVQLCCSVVCDSETPWTAARQASLSITNSWSLPKPMSIESVMPSNHFILCRPLLLLPLIFPSIRSFQMSQIGNYSLHQVAKVLEFQLQHHIMANRWGNSGNSGWLYFFGLQNHCRWWLQPWN